MEERERERETVVLPSLFPISLPPKSLIKVWNRIDKVPFVKLIINEL